MNIYYKDIELQKREYNIVDNKKKYIPLHIFIYKNDALKMLENMYKFYSELSHELHLLYKNNKRMLKTDKDYISYISKKSNILRLKNRLKNGTYKNFIIEFDKRYNKRPNRNNYTKILYYLSIDGYIPHVDKLEII